MKEIEYIIGKVEGFGCLGTGDKAKAFVLFEDCDGGNCLLYFPPKLKYFDEETKKWRTELGCGCLSFGFKDDDGIYKRVEYEKPDMYFINLDSKNDKKIQKLLKI